MPASPTLPTNAVLNQHVEELKRQVDAHDLFIDGNGKPGAKERLGLIESSIMQMQKSVNWVLGLLVSFITIAAGITIWFITDVLPELYRGLGSMK